MPNYQNGKIYKIIDSENKVIYIGSTTEQLCKRYAKHKHKAIGNKIILLENYHCNSREELLKKEQEHIESHENLLNQMRAFNSEEYWEQYNKEYSKKWYDNNKDKILEYQKNYDENNKEYISEYKTQWYVKNKDKLLEKITCECGCEILKIHMVRHRKTKKHIKLMETK